MICSILWNANRSKDDEAKPPEDFMPYYEGPEIDQDEILEKRTAAIMARKQKRQENPQENH